LGFAIFNLRFAFVSYSPPFFTAEMANIISSLFSAGKSQSQIAN